VLHAAPGAGFEQPFEMLQACHERVERMLGLLERLAQHLAEVGADAPARQAARDLMRYFDLAAPNHHEDEERHVFPALRTLGQGALADRLHADHEAMAGLWAELRAALVALADDGAAALPDVVRCDFAALYRRHLADEEALAYPPVAASTDAAGRERMADEMARRRGIR
jgi:hemerythrin-like domain-containing protein